MHKEYLWRKTDYIIFCNYVLPEDVSVIASWYCAIKYTALIKLDAIFSVIERVLQENIFKKLATLLSGEHKML